MKKLSLWCLMTLLFCACSTQGLEINEQIRLNQLGFYPAEKKVAVFVGTLEDATFRVRNLSDGSVVYTGQADGPRASDFSDKKNYVMDFSSFAQSGHYAVELTVGQSFPFTIQEDLLKEVSIAALKGFYIQRSGVDIEELYAGQWHRKGGHPDMEVMIHPSAASASRPANTIIASPKGWYDAGDYNKYSVNSGFTVGVMLSLFEDYPDYMKQLSVNIPESANQTPDLLDEVAWNIDWMLSLQDPADGGVYHKLTTSGFEGFIAPIDCRKPRYVVAKSNTAALDFAASMAQASRVYAAYAADYPGYAEKTLQAARRAFDWACQHPEQYYRQRELSKQFKPEISTGEYGDRKVTDEFFWAATELYISTGEAHYRKYIDENMPERFHLPTWSTVDGLGVFSILRHADRIGEATFVEAMREILLKYSRESLEGYESAPYAAPYGRKTTDFFWGCNSDAASNQGMTFLYAWRLTGNRQFLTAALQTMDYILGRNATGYCYITGYGSRSPQFPHHRLSASDGIAEPIPGLLIGGPNPGKQDGCDYPSDIADECYVDVEPSYAANEMAINWQALFSYFSNALNASL